MLPMSSNKPKQTLALQRAREEVGEVGGDDQSTESNNVIAKRCHRIADDLPTATRTCLYRELAAVGAVTTRHGTRTTNSREARGEVTEVTTYDTYVYVCGKSIPTLARARLRLEKLLSNSRSNIVRSQRVRVYSTCPTSDVRARSAASNGCSEPLARACPQALWVQSLGEYPRSSRRTR